MKVTVRGDLAHASAESVLDAGLLAGDAYGLKGWGNSGLGFLESSQPTAFSRDVPASLR
ncbi:hypothetical protein [Variovorax sp. PDC80]|uniref:hypothetical protein n=1 Tax=Variovorax sp. PDC80 TaxID=1882827 RepID=UPI0015A4F5AC|nr:hypothetical protein [Variovorax sp. PDC80]